MVLQSFTEFYQVSQGCTGFYWISSDCHGFYWVLPGITALQQFPTSLIRRWKRWKKICFGFSGFFFIGDVYRVLPGSAGQRTSTRRPRPAKGFDEEAKRPEGQEEADDAKR